MSRLILYWIFLSLLLTALFIIFFETFLLSNLDDEVTNKPYIRDVLDAYIINTKGCRIPSMDIMNPSIKKYIFRVPPIQCNDGIPPLIDSNLTHLYLLASSLSSPHFRGLSNLRCCYHSLKEIKKDLPILHNSCIPFEYSAKIEHEFVEVLCTYEVKKFYTVDNRVYKDYFSFVPIKPKVKDYSHINSRKAKLNVLIIGIDSMSRLNLLRQMPKTVQILRKINAVEFLGYSKVADNTFPNLVVMLSGLNENQFLNECHMNDYGDYNFDRCPLIWKRFSRNGYATAFAEDLSWLGIFKNGLSGFLYPPSNYYWGPFDYKSEYEIGNMEESPARILNCVGGRIIYKTLLEYMLKFVETMRKNAIVYFGLFWCASLSHHYLNKPQLGDDDYEQLFHMLNSSGALNRTAVIFLSDHGIRTGDMRSTYQGRVEERLPFLFMLLPEDYKKKHNLLYTNLRRNTKRLTTTFDIYKTLTDLLNPYDLTEEVLSRRRNLTLKKSYSLFEYIPTERTCASALIAPHWCTCQKAIPVNKENDVVVRAANFTVTHINKQLENYTSCAELALAGIYDARLHVAYPELIELQDMYFRDYAIAFRTTPGNASFDVTVREYVLKNSSHLNFSVTGTISRTNLYRKQSFCIKNVHLKLYCFCKNSSGAPVKYNL